LLPRHHASALHSSVLLFYLPGHPRDLHSFPTRRSSDLIVADDEHAGIAAGDGVPDGGAAIGRKRQADEGGERAGAKPFAREGLRSEEHTSELQSLTNLVCRLLLEKKKQKYQHRTTGQNT